MKNKILKTINASWFPGIFIILALIIFSLSVFFDKNQSNLSSEKPTYTLGTFTVKVEGLRNNKGNAIACLYTSPPFNRENQAGFQLTNIVDGKAILLFNDIPSGDYVFFVFHDENANNILDFGKNIVSQEGVGFSNINKPLQVMPDFDEAKIHLDKGTSEIQVAVFYY